MATIPSERTWVLGEGTDETKMGNLSQCMDFYFKSPGAHVYTQSGLWINPIQTTLINWENSYFQNDNNWSASSPSRVFCNCSGLYDITASIVWGSGTSNSVGSNSSVFITKNTAGSWPGISSSSTVLTDTEISPGGGYIGGSTGVTLQGSGMANHVDGLYYLAAGDYIEMFARFYRGSGSVQRYIRPGAFRTFLSISFVDA